MSLRYAAGRLLIFSLLILTVQMSWAESSLQRRASKECAICHLRWTDDFEGEQKRKFLLDFTEDKVVATEMMCYSCHDGSVLDSRLRVWETNRHKAGTKPSGKISIPDNFPVDEEGRLICATCHSAHGVDSTTDMGSTIFLREPNVNSSLCRKCHGDKDDGVAAGKHPVDAPFDDMPQQILEAGGKAGKDEQGRQTVICESCHTPHGSTSQHFLVIPNSEKGLTHSMLCESCHTVSPDLNSSDLLRRYSHPVGEDLMEEAKLPEQWDNGEKPYLGDGKAVNCRTCHSPHNGTEDNHLLVTKNDKGSFCLVCHTSKEKIFNTKHDLARLFPDEKNAEGRPASETGTCFVCHAMHKGRGPKMWAREAAGETIDKLCKSCHRKGGLAKDALTGENSHPINARMKKGESSGDLPLFAGKGKRSPGGTVSCASCHDPHRWSPTSDRRGGKDVEGDGSDSFLRRPSKPDGALCRTCHKDKTPILGSKHDMELMFPKSKNQKLQTADDVGTCDFCHAPHNALGKKLWALKAKETDDTIEGLCLTCHAKGGLAEKKQIGLISHPIGAKPDVAPGAGGKLPLFRADGKRDPKGGVTCATCHDLHTWEAGKRKSPGKKKIEGDRSNSFLRVPYGESAELCAVCHRDNALVAGTDHDLRMSAPRAVNLNRQKADQSGVCGACHLVHNAFGDQLWARGVGMGENRIQALCSGCHAHRKAASKKPVGDSSHPMNVGLTDTGSRLRNRLQTDLPLFAQDGKRSKEGDITCATCHNAHRWNPDESSAGPGEKSEGDARNSFLRRSNLPRPKLCADCHNLKERVVGTDHDLSVTAPDALNGEQKSVAQSGVCSPCHIPHGAEEGGYLLWARPTDEEAGARPERICLSCHAEGRVGGGKVPDKLLHPHDVKARILPERMGVRVVRAYTPLYDDEGKVSETGIVACPTCHDAHIWSSDIGLQQGSGENLEGNARTSFLRERSKFSVCSNCHGMDALFRYKFFHHRDSREKHELFRTRPIKKP